MEENQNLFDKENFNSSSRQDDIESSNLRHSIESDEDTLEPFDDQAEHREINADDPADLAKWADEFQISVDDLKAAIVLNGNKVREIKKYLSV